MKIFLYLFGFIIALAAVITTGGTILIPVAIVLIVKWLFGRSSKQAPSGAGSASVDSGKHVSGSVSPSGSKICGHCGAENPSDAAYCERCGHKLS